MNRRVLIAIVLASTSLLGPGVWAGQRPPSTVDDRNLIACTGSLLSTEWPVWPASHTRGAARTAATTTALVHHETLTSDCMFARGQPIDRSGSVVIERGVVRPITAGDFGGRVWRPDPTWQPVLDAYLAAQPTVRTVLPGPGVGVPGSSLTKGQGNPNGVESGYIQVSAVGFDAAKTRAMVFIAYECGGLCGGGNLYLLEKVSGSWREKPPRYASGGIRVTPLNSATSRAVGSSDESRPYLVPHLLKKPP